jgi:hypothetical protein
LTSSNSKLFEKYFKIKKGTVQMGRSTSQCPVPLSRPCSLTTQTSPPLPATRRACQGRPPQPHATSPSIRPRPHLSPFLSSSAQAPVRLYFLPITATPVSYPSAPFPSKALVAAVGDLFPKLPVQVVAPCNTPCYRNPNPRY